MCGALRTAGLCAGGDAGFCAGGVGKVPRRPGGGCAGRGCSLGSGSGLAKAVDGGAGVDCGGGGTSFSSVSRGGGITSRGCGGRGIWVALSAVMSAGGGIPTFGSG